MMKNSLFARSPLKALERGPYEPRRPPGRSRSRGGQPFVPLFSGRRVSVVVFSQQRGIEPDPEQRGEAPQAFRKTRQGHDVNAICR
jgi:hypothetical protein